MSTYNFSNKLCILSILLGLLSMSTIVHANKPVIPESEIHKVRSFKYSTEKGQISYGGRIYKNNCQSCHGPIGVSYLSRLETPVILGLSGQQIVDRLVYYRDAESYGILLTGKALLMSRQSLFLNDDQINSIARYFEELNPLSDLNIAKEKSREEERMKRRQARISNTEIEKLQATSPNGKKNKKTYQ